MSTVDMGFLARVWKILLAVAMVIVGFLYYPSESAQQVKREDDGRITGPARILDADTIKIGRKRIRLKGIDAPENGQKCGDAGPNPWTCGKHATAVLTQKIKRRPVICEPEAERDRYNRVLAVCFLDGEDLNGWLVQQGWAMAYLQYSKRYARHEYEARQAKRGIWRGCFTPPWDWRRGKRECGGY